MNAFACFHYTGKNNGLIIKSSQNQEAVPMSVAITCYGAVEEIGGNKILLADGSTRLMLDFGTSFKRLGQFYNEFLRPRPARGLLDPLMLGLLPDLRGIYRPDLEIDGLWEHVERHFGRKAVETHLDAVLLSHAHLDHNGDVSYLDDSVPVFATRASALISRVLQVSGPGGVEREMAYTNPRKPNAEGDLGSERSGSYRLRPHAFLDGGLNADARAFWASAGGSRNKAIQPAEALPAAAQIGGVGLRWWPVDHSIPGACGYALQTSAGWVAYTGDIRFHGRRGEQTRRFMHALAELRPRVLLCEGTHITPHQPISEDQIAEKALPLIQRYAGRLVIADFGPRNLERLAIFLELAERTGRMLLAQPKDIYLLQTLALGEPEVYGGLLAHPSLGMYADPKSAPRAWEKELRILWQARTTGPRLVAQHPGDYLLAYSLFDLNDLIDLDGARGGAYLFSNSRAYDDEQAADLERLRTWVSWMGMDLLGDPDDPNRTDLHASGHASGEELLEFVRTVNPQTLVPIHCENPGWWETQLSGSRVEVRPPKIGQAIGF
jgi:ribonuclease J